MQPGNLAEQVVDRITSLCRPLGLAPEPIVACFRDVVAPWIQAPEGWRSEIADDHSPVELSVTLDDSPALRVLFEPQGAEPTLARFREAGLAFHELIGQSHGADLRRLRAVQDLFLPEFPQGALAIVPSTTATARCSIYFTTNASACSRPPPTT
jgi:hypothetical protein